MRKIRLIFTALLLISPFAANAVPIVAANGDIANMDVGGTLFDVAWNFGASNPVAGDFALFDGNEPFADLFMDTVLATFISSAFAGVAGQTFYGVDFAALTCGCVQDIAGIFSRADGGHGVWGAFPEAGWGSVSRSVPEPGTLLLLGIGLAGIGLTRRGKKV